MDTERRCEFGVTLGRCSRIRSGPGERRRRDASGQVRRRRIAYRAAARSPSHAHDLARGRAQARQHHVVVAPDLRGYGQSTPPPDEPDHAQSSKRAMASDVVALMTHLGHDRFAVVGHDRGALVAFRTAMDHPEARDAPGRHGRAAGHRASRTGRRPVRRGVVALVVPRPDRQARRTRHLPGPRRLVRHPRRPPRWAKATTPTCGRRSATLRSSTAWPRTTAPASASTATTTPPTARRADALPARRCC